jgi:hypothetical protein
MSARERLRRWGWKEEAARKARRRDAVGWEIGEWSTKDMTKRGRLGGCGRAGRRMEEEGRGENAARDGLLRRDCPSEVRIWSARRCGVPSMMTEPAVHRGWLPESPPRDWPKSCSPRHRTVERRTMLDFRQSLGQGRGRSGTSSGRRQAMGEVVTSDMSQCDLDFSSEFTSSSPRRCGKHAREVTSR